MANNNRRSRRKNKVDRENEKKIESVGDFNVEYKNIILLVGIILIIFAVFYFITVYVTNKDSNTYKRSKDTEGVISYTEIMAGRSFDMPEAEYYILYYDRSNKELLNTFSSSVAAYRADKERTALYTVDMSNAMNKGFEKEDSNWNPTSVSELAIKGPTLIHFRDGAVIEYFEGETDIVSQLN